jgi:hypothetical protein
MNSTDGGTQSDLNETHFANASCSIRARFESAAKLTALNFSQLEKQLPPMTWTDDGMEIDSSAAQEEKVDSAITTKFELSPKETVRRSLQTAKQRPPSEVTDDGMQMDESFEQVRNALSSIEEILQFPPNSTETSVARTGRGPLTRQFRFRPESIFRNPVQNIGQSGRDQNPLESRRQCGNVGSPVRLGSEPAGTPRSSPHRPVPLMREDRWISVMGTCRMHNF